MKSINPSWKLIGILVPIVILAFFYSITLNLVILGLALRSLRFQRFAGRRRESMIPVAVLAVGMYMTGAKFHAGANIGIGAGNALLSDAALENGLQLGSAYLRSRALACCLL